MTTKLKIIGPYTPEHPGPFCTRYGNAARVLITDCNGDKPVIALVDNGTTEAVHKHFPNGASPAGTNYDLMNAEEVPVAREFWINEYPYGLSDPFKSEVEAKLSMRLNFIRTIHVREVLPGEGE